MKVSRVQPTVQPNEATEFVQPTAKVVQPVDSTKPVQPKPLTDLPFSKQKQAQGGMR